MRNGDYWPMVRFGYEGPKRYLHANHNNLKHCGLCGVVYCITCAKERIEAGMFSHACLLATTNPDHFPNTIWVRR